MATLFNTRISDTYQGLIKTIDNTAITASLKELTDGSGNSTGIYLNNAGDFKVTAILEFGSLKDTGENIIISKFVDAADGISNNDNDTTIPTTAAIVDYVAAQITIEDLDFTGDTGSGQIDLDSQIFAIGGTTNEITTVASGQSITFSLDSTGVYLPDNSTAITQTAGDNSTKIATTSYVDTLDAASDLDITDGTNTGDVNLNTQSLSILGTTNEIDTVVSGQGVTIGLPSTINTNLIGNVTGNLTGNVTGDLTGNVTSTSVLANGVTATTQSSSDDSTKVATTAYVKGLNNASDLDFTTDSGSGAVVLNSETLSVVGTTNEIETSGTGQEIQIGLPNSISTNLVGNVTGNLTGNVVGDVTGDLTGNSAGTHTGAVIGNVTGNVTGDLTGNADTATAWQTSRDLSVTGQASATIIGVDGTSNVSAAITLDNNSVTSKVLTGLPSPAASSVLATDTIVQGIGKLQSQINGLAGGLRFMGSWDATNNNPNLVSGGGEATSGTTTSTTANKLVDSTASFTTTVTVGDKVINQVDGQNALVSNVDSDTTLSLDTDIMVSGEAYTIDNSPFITQGHYYVVNVGGTTSLNGISNWSVGDWVIAGANNEWTKLDHTQIDGTGTGDANDGNIPRFTASNIIGDSIIRETGGNLITVSGTLSTTGNLNAQGDFAINTDKFTSQASTGNTAFTGNLAINTDKFTVNATSGNTLVAGDLDVNGANADFAGEIDANGEIRSYYNGANYSRLLSSVDGGSVSGFNSSGGSFIIRDHSYSQIVSDGNFGIGIGGSSAIQKVHIQGTGTTYMHIANDTTGSLTTDGADIGFFTGQTALQILNRENDSVIISTNDLPRLTIDGSGNSTFAGNVSITNASTPELILTDTTNNHNLLIAVDDSNTFLRSSSGVPILFQTNAGTTALTLDSSQNATFAGSITSGIGNNFDPIIREGRVESAPAYSFTNDLDTGMFNPNTANTIAFATGGTEKMRIDSSGNLSLATATSLDFQVADFAQIKFRESGAITIDSDNDQSSRNFAIKDGDGTNLLTVLDTGNVGIGVTPYSYSRLTTEGSDNTSSNYAFIAYSENTNAILACRNDGQVTIPSGNLGIGTNSPDFKLQIQGGTNTEETVLKLDKGVTGDTGGHTTILGFGTETGAWAKAGIGFERTGSYDRGKIHFLQEDTVTTDTATLSDSVMTIDSSGNVGIGTTSPGTKLDVAGEISSSDDININNGKLVVNHTSAEVRIKSSSNTGESYINFSDPSDINPGQIFYGHTDNKMVFRTNDAERMRIDSSGKITSTGASEGVVKVVGSSASHRAEVMVEGAGQFTASFVAITGSAPAYGGIPAGTAGITTSSTDLVFATNSTERMRITSGGEVLIRRASYTDTTFSLQVGDAASDSYRPIRCQVASTGTRTQIAFYNTETALVGTISTSGTSTAYNTSSDYRLKEDLQDFAGLDMVSKIPVYDFKWKDNDDYEDCDKRSYGVIAHELQEVLPQAVSGEKDAEEMQGVDYSKIVPLLVKSIQELKAEVDKLKQECKCKN